MDEVTLVVVISGPFSLSCRGNDRMWAGRELAPTCLRSLPQVSTDRAVIVGFSSAALMRSTLWDFTGYQDDSTPVRVLSVHLILLSG